MRSLGIGLELGSLLSGEAPPPTPRDQPGSIAMSFGGRNNRNLRADLSDPDTVVSVQTVQFTYPNGNTVTQSSLSERGGGVWRATRNNAIAAGEYTVVFTYTDSLGSGKTATETITR